MATKVTRNTAVGSIAFIDASWKHNLQAVCEAVFGILSTEIFATWSSDNNSLTVTDSRVLATSRILIGTPQKGTNNPTGLSYYIESVSDGSFVIKSQNAEVSGTILPYFVINA